jgi:hypothetical protein
MLGKVSLGLGFVGQEVKLSSVAAICICLHYMYMQSKKLGA